MNDEDRDRHLANLADAMVARQAMRARRAAEDTERAAAREAELAASDAGLRHFAAVTGLHNEVAQALASEAAALPPAPAEQPAQPLEHDAVAASPGPLGGETAPEPDAAG